MVLYFDDIVRNYVSYYSVTRVVSKRLNGYILTLEWICSLNDPKSSWHLFLSKFSSYSKLIY